MAQNILRVANYDITLAEATKGIKNPADRAGFERAVYAVNPKYDMSTAASVEQFRKEMKDPKSKCAEMNILLALDSIIRESAYLARKLPDWGNPTLNKYIADPLAEFFHPQDIDAYEANLDQFSKLYDRLQRLSKPSS